MYKVSIIALVLTMLCFAGRLSAQERGVEFSFMPNVKDTLAGFALQFELVAINEDGDLIRDWDISGFPVQLIVHNSTANLDTNQRQWNGDPFGYSYARLYDGFGKEFMKASPNAFNIPNDKFSEGRLQVAFTHSKAEQSVYLEVLPKLAASAKQNTLMYNYFPGSVHNFALELTSSTADPDQVYLMREYECIVSARDRFMNVTNDPVRVLFTSQFPDEYSNLNSKPEMIEGPTSILLTSTVSRARETDQLQFIRVFRAEDQSVSGRSNMYEILDHAPSQFLLTTPADEMHIDLENSSTSIEFAWTSSTDPYTDIAVSRFSSTQTSDTLRYTISFADRNNLVKFLSFDSDNDGMATHYTTTHGSLADIAATVHHPDAASLDAVWFVTASDGLFQTTSSSSSPDFPEGHRIMANISTLAVERLTAQAEDFTLSQNYPNPFNPTTRIEYSLPVRTPVRILVYDIYGSIVTTLVDTISEPGIFAIEWDSTNSRGEPVSSGNYILSMIAGMHVESRNMSLVK